MGQNSPTPFWVEGNHLFSVNCKPVPVPKTCAPWGIFCLSDELGRINPSTGFEKQTLCSTGQETLASHFDASYWIRCVYVSRDLLCPSPGTSLMIMAIKTLLVILRRNILEISDTQANMGTLWILGC